MARAARLEQVVLVTRGMPDANVPVFGGVQLVLP